MKALGRCLSAFSVAFMFFAKAAAAEQAQHHPPNFQLRISTGARTFKAQKGVVIPVRVKEKNLSRRTVYGPPLCDWVEERYSIDVALDGKPAPITEKYRELLAPKKLDPNILATSGPEVPIRAGETQACEVAVNEFVNMDRPGKYQIVFRLRNPDQVEGFPLKSNTITITVLPAGAQ